MRDFVPRADVLRSTPIYSIKRFNDTRTAAGMFLLYPQLRSSIVDSRTYWLAGQSNLLAGWTIIADDLLFYSINTRMILSSTVLIRAKMEQRTNIWY